MEELVSDPHLDSCKPVQVQSCVELLLRDCQLPASPHASSPERQRFGCVEGRFIAESFVGQQQRRRLGIASADLGRLVGFIEGGDVDLAIGARGAVLSGIPSTDPSL